MASSRLEDWLLSWVPTNAAKSRRCSFLRAALRPSALPSTNFPARLLVLEQEFSETLAILDNRVPSLRQQQRGHPWDDFRRPPKHRASTSFASLDYATFRVSSSLGRDGDYSLVDFDDYLASEIGPLKHASSARDRREAYIGGGKKWQSEAATLQLLRGGGGGGSRKTKLLIERPSGTCCSSPSSFTTTGPQVIGTSGGGSRSLARKLGKNQQQQHQRTTTLAGSRRMGCRTFTTAASAAKSKAAQRRNATSTVRKSGRFLFFIFTFSLPPSLLLNQTFQFLCFKQI